MWGACEWILNTLNNLIESMTTNQPLLWASLSTVESKLYQYTSACQPYILSVAYTFLSLFFLLEMWNISKRVESFGGSSQMGVELIFGLLIKLVLCKMILDNGFVLMEALYMKMASITAHLNQAWSAGGFHLSLDAAGSGGFWVTIVVFLLAIVVLLIVAVAWLISRIIIWLRFIEIYLYMIIAPIPLATLPSDEWGQIGKGFLKSFLALCLQGTLIFLVLSFFPVLAGAMGFGEITTDMEIIKSLLSAAGISVLLIFALLGTNRLANSILGMG